MVAAAVDRRSPVAYTIRLNQDSDSNAATTANAAPAAEKRAVISVS